MPRNRRARPPRTGETAAMPSACAEMLTPPKAGPGTAGILPARLQQARRRRGSTPAVPRSPAPAASRRTRQPRRRLGRAGVPARTFPRGAMSARKRERTRRPPLPAEPIAAEFRYRLSNPDTASSVRVVIVLRQQINAATAHALGLQRRKALVPKRIAPPRQRNRPRARPRQPPPRFAPSARTMAIASPGPRRRRRGRRRSGGAVPRSLSFGWLRDIMRLAGADTGCRLGAQRRRNNAACFTIRRRFSWRVARGLTHRSAQTSCLLSSCGQGRGAGRQHAGGWQREPLENTSGPRSEL